MNNSLRVFVLEALCLLIILSGLAYSSTINDLSNPDIPIIQSTVLFEDFDSPSGWNGTNPPSNWSIIDSATSDAVWDTLRWHRFQGWGGYFARVKGNSSDKYNDDWIISPAVDFYTDTLCILSFRHYYFDYSFQSADSALVLLSDDNGASWGDTVFVYTEQSYGSPTVPDSEFFNISDFAAGKSSIKAAFQYVKRDAVVAGQWRIDDIKFIADGSQLMNQDFEGSWGPYGNNPPADWGIQHFLVKKWDNNDWHQSNAVGWGNMARVFFSPIEQQNEWLQSPPIDLSTGSLQAYVYVKQWYDDWPLAADTAFILGSNDGGVTWPYLVARYHDSDHGSSGTAAYDTFDITGWANGHSNARLAFKYVASNAAKWYIDSLKVVTVDRYPHDAAVIQIVEPSANSINGYPWPVTAKIENAGLNTESFDVSFLIADSIGAIVYSDTQSVTDLPSATQTELLFDAWSPAENNSHTITCHTMLGTDVHRTNDTLTSTTFTHPHRGFGGPVERWTFRDNITGEGPAFSWYELRSVGSEASFADPDDGNSGMVDMGMEFRFFETAYTRINININGWVSFEDSISTDYSPSGIPDADGPSAMIAALWADLHLRNGHVYYYKAPGEPKFIIQYDSLEYKDIAGSYIDLELIFNSYLKTITAQYKTISSSFQSQQTIGIEKSGETVGLAYNNLGELGQSPRPGLAVSFIYLPDHDVSPVSMTIPSILFAQGNSYDINARIANCGSQVESFDVTAVDNYGYSNTQHISNLGSLDSASVSFSPWNIGNECSDYTLKIITELPLDEFTSNDTIQKSMESAPAENTDFRVDDGNIVWSLAFDDTNDVFANRFRVSYEGATLSSMAFKCINEDEFPAGGAGDTIKASIFLDADLDSIPDNIPIYSKKIQVPKTGWTIWNIGCDTTIVLNCEYFWVGWSINDTLPPALLAVDITVNHQSDRWARQGGVWDRLFGHHGDYFIRAFVNADSISAPIPILGAYQVNGVAQPDGADTAGTTIDNGGIGCDLDYKVKVVQNASSMALNLSPPQTIIPFETIVQSEIIHRNSEKTNSQNSTSEPPMISNFGGPDIYGYTWKDSHESDGPSYLWYDISGLGTEVNWNHGDSNEGFTDPIDLGLTFSFYGIDYTRIIIGTNGWASFGRPYATSAVNNPIPNIDELNALLAVDWDNLDGGTSGRCYTYYDPIANRFIISWVGWCDYPAPNYPHDFQIILNGYDNSIIYQYGAGIFRPAATVGIEDESGTVGLQVAYNQPYLTNNLAIRFKPPIKWLSTSLVGGIIAPDDPALPFNIFMNAALLPTGSYHGQVVILNNAPNTDSISIIDVNFSIEGVCSYVPGDVNGSGSANGLDVTYMVNFFKGGDAPRESCPPCSEYGNNMLYPQGDVNGSCSWNGLDVTYFVNYFKGMGPPPVYCQFCPPAGRSTNTAPVQPTKVKIEPPKNDKLGMN